MTKNDPKVAVFIDNSNVFKNIKRIQESDPKWTNMYDPLKLAKILAGERKLVHVGFYCTRPPSYLLNEGEEGKFKYKTTNQYYNAIEKLSLVEVRYGELKGGKGGAHEKNLDTKMSTDIVEKAALGEYDVAVIVSNDGDFASALESAERFGKKIEVVFFRGSLSMILDKESDIKRRARRSYFKPIEGKNNNQKNKEVE